jgi:hypothetical protein
MSNPFVNSLPNNPKPTFSDAAPDPISADAPRTYNPFLDGPVGADAPDPDTTAVAAETATAVEAVAGETAVVPEAVSETAVDEPVPARGRKAPTKAKVKAVAPAESSPIPPTLADALAKSIVGQHPLDIADALDTVFARTRAGVRPVDMLRLCKSIRNVSDAWYGKVRDALLEGGNDPGEYYGYRITEVAPSRKVDYDRLRKEFPEAYEAVVSKGDKPGYRFILEGPEDGDTE